MAKGKDMNIKIAGDQVMFSNISKSKDGYNSARVVAKMNENEYMSVSYEWEGNAIPDFAMSLMGFMQANDMEVGSIIEAHVDDYAEFSAKKGVNPFAKKKDDEEDDDKKKKDPKKDKKDDKKKKKEKSDEDKTLEDE